ncbi:MAG: phosphate ABC transporter permease subunit PstC [Verrucomicrobiota bacterium]
MEATASDSSLAAGTRRVSRSRRIAAERAIKVFFGSNALVAIAVLALITIFLFREGFGFFGENLTNLRLYRRAGLEYVDVIRAQAQQHAALARELSQIRLRENDLSALAVFDQFAGRFSDAGEELNALLSDTSDEAVALRDALIAAPGEAIDLTQLRAAEGRFGQIVPPMREKIDNLIQNAPALRNARAQTALAKWERVAQEFLAQLPGTLQQLQAWDPLKPVPAYRAVTSFLFGTEWITASFWQDWYGIIPLFVGSILVATVAMVIAVPFGVASAIYVSEVAGQSEKSLIKPYLEFVSAIPSVVLGFFGIAVFGETVRALSRLPIFSWVPFFPIEERLNIFTAGCLLALMAVPSIFTLSEDALRNVPRGFKEASYALGANRLQTIARVLVPASLSGIVSASLLGLGRVIGETMVVLLCAGNRIAIPDFTQGLGTVFQPVHTMTGIIAQEMGEVVRGSIHYRALFMVGLVLFGLTLGINYLAQRVVARYRMSIG